MVTSEETTNPSLLRCVVLALCLLAMTVRPAHDRAVAAVYTYSRNQGLLAGVSLEGTVIVARNDANKEYCGRAVTPKGTPKDILSGMAEPPPGAEKLIAELKRTEVVRVDGASSESLP
jgi:lipid-binding SYLF domain-containing protein